MTREEEIKGIIEQANQYNAPAKINDISVASFAIRSNRKGLKTSELILALITKSISEQVAISREDIHRLYWLYKTDNETVAPQEQREYFSGEGWKNVVFDRDSFINHYRMQRNAIGWFKAGLSSAILEGKLLVLPIIQI